MVQLRWCEREKAVMDVGCECEEAVMDVGCEREEAVTDVGGEREEAVMVIMLSMSVRRQWWMLGVSVRRQWRMLEVSVRRQWWWSCWVWAWEGSDGCWGECEQTIMVQSQRGWVWAGNDGSIMFGASIITDTLCKLSYHTHDITYMHLRARITFSTVVLPLAPCTLSTSILPLKHSIPTQQLTRFPWTWLLGYRCSLGTLLLSRST